MNFKIVIRVMLAISALNNTAIAQVDEDFDASDLTRANTTAIVGMNNQGDVKATGSLSYQFKNKQTAMTLLEGTMDKDGKYKDARLQYFHVFNLDNQVTPRIAASLDIINNDSFSTAAIGAIALFKTPMDSLTFFARGGLMTGQYSDDFSQQMKITNKDIRGGMAAAYAVLKTGDDGTFVAAYPEFTYLDGDAEIQSRKFTLMAATPFSADGKRWGQIKVENTSGETTDGTGLKRDMASETIVWFNYKAYF